MYVWVFLYRGVFTYEPYKQKTTTFYMVFYPRNFVVFK